MTTLNPYISFRGTAREAMEYYAALFGGELTLSTFRDFGMPGVADEELDLIMHGNLAAPGGMTLMGADAPASMQVPAESYITISLSGDDDAELRRVWAGLADGGNVTMPLEVAPWGDAFGELTDRFGVKWMMNIAGAANGAGS